MTPLLTDDSYLAKGKFAPYGYIYFLRWSEGVVKIGFTTDPYQRFLDHQTACALYRGTKGEPLSLIAIMKFQTPDLAEKIEGHLQAALNVQLIEGQSELFALPEVAAGQSQSVENFLNGFVIGKVLTDHEVRASDPTASAWDDSIVAAACRASYFAATKPVRECVRLYRVKAAEVGRAAQAEKRGADSEWREKERRRLTEIAVKGRSSQAKKRVTDPEYREREQAKMARITPLAHAALAKKRASDADYQQREKARVANMGKKGNASQAKKRVTDPEWRARERDRALERAARRLRYRYGRGPNPGQGSLFT